MKFVTKITFSILIYFFIGSFINNYAQQLAFPGAEGYGKFTTGGRGGKVIEVTTLEDNSNPGSFRYAINQSGARTIVFRVSGTIFLKSKLSISKGDLTIAGQTAPGDGICIAGYTPSINADNIIVRYMRFRLGDINDIEDDAFNGRNRKNIIIDHCSMTWSVDECASFYDNQNFTMQWCIIGESLFNSVHQKGEHGYGGIQGGMGATFHHNLYINNTSRNPRFCGARYHHSTASTEIVDFVNNVIYNWGFNSVYGGELGQQNVRNNYYKAGPATKKTVRNRIVNPTIDSGTDSGLGKFFVDGNYVESYPTTTQDNWATGVQGIGITVIPQIKVDTAFGNIDNIEIQTAEEAYQSVLDKVGPNFPKLDSVDARLVNEARTGLANYEGKTYKAEYIKDLQDTSLITGIIDSQSEVGGWPVLNSIAPANDTDHDGMPDYYETANGLNPNDAADGKIVSASGYTNLEIFLNGLVDGTVTSVQEEKNVPAKFLLNQNYPNPFNPTTKINFSIPANNLSATSMQSVTLKIYDLLGREISTLVNEQKAPGNYEVTFDGSRLASGTYFYVLNCGGFINSKKMILIK